MRQPPCPYCGLRHILGDTCLSPMASSLTPRQEDQRAITPLPIFLINEAIAKVLPVKEAEGGVTQDTEPIRLEQWPHLFDSIPPDPGNKGPSVKDTLEETAYIRPTFDEDAPTEIAEDEEVLRSVEEGSTDPGNHPTTSAEASDSVIYKIGVSGVGSLLGDYRLVEKLGEGGMGQIFRVRHVRLDTEAAIKLLKASVASQEVVRRFFQEALVVNEIRHENVIDILNLGRTEYGEYFLLMELLKGETLHQALASAPFSKGKLLHIGEQLCAGLQACHQRGIAHRDLKSENIFLINRGAQKNFVKILDFGLAKLYNSNLRTPGISSVGMIYGTPLCMSPEQVCGEEIDHQTDIYALGVLLYQMSTGQPPFFDLNPMALLKMHLMSEPIPPSKRGSSLGRSFDAIVLRCLEKERRRRYQSIEEVTKELRHLR
jgi:hypothetical protein